MSDTVNCPFCAASTGAEIPLPVIVTPIKGGVHVESYRPCPECGRFVCYDEVPDDSLEDRPKEITGFAVEWTYNDGERGYSDRRTFGADQYEEANELCNKLNHDPDTLAYLWPIERPVQTAAERTQDALSQCRTAENAPSASLFKIDLEILSRTVYDLKLQLGADGQDFLVAEADEILTTLRIVQDQEDLRAAGVTADLRSIARRLAE